MYRSFDIRLQDSAFEPFQSEKRIFVKTLDKTKLYKVWLYLEGNDLPYVRSVTYKLHPTFPNPERTVMRRTSNPHCNLTIWTWGLFTVTATVFDKKGASFKLEHRLTYDSQLREKGVEFVDS